MLLNSRACLCAGAIALGLSLPCVAQASSYVLSTTGTISSGFDATGVFGSVGSLAGKSYTLSAMFDPSQLTLDTDGATYSTLSSPSSFSNASAVVITATVNGLSFSETLSDGFGTLSLDVLGTFSNADLYANAGGTAADGQFVDVYNEVGSDTDDFIPGPGLDQTILHQVLSSDLLYSGAAFDTAGVDGTADFSATPSQITLQSVPEPATLGVLGLGLAGLGVLRRRRQA